MKNIRNYYATKYDCENYEKVEKNIYKTLYTSTDTLEGLSNTEMINVLKNLKDWKKSTNGLYEIEYESKKYYILRRDYESGYMHKILVPLKPKEIYVTSLVFVPEPELGENNPTDGHVSQYPLEDILDKFNCFCTDYYEEENKADLNNSYQEFASKKIEDIQNLLRIVGKHVYNKEENGEIKLIIE